MQPKNFRFTLFSAAVVEQLSAVLGRLSATARWGGKSGFLKHRVLRGFRFETAINLGKTALFALVESQGRDPNANLQRAARVSENTVFYDESCKKQRFYQVKVQNIAKSMTKSV